MTDTHTLIPMGAGEPETFRGRIYAAAEDPEAPFFFKQWGGVMKKIHGRILDGRTHDAFPACVAAKV